MSKPPNVAEVIARALEAWAPPPSVTDAVRERLPEGFDPTTLEAGIRDQLATTAAEEVGRQLRRGGYTNPSAQDMHLVIDHCARYVQRQDLTRPTEEILGRVLTFARTAVLVVFGEPPDPQPEQPTPDTGQWISAHVCQLITVALKIELERRRLSARPEEMQQIAALALRTCLEVGALFSLDPEAVPSEELLASAAGVSAKQIVDQVYDPRPMVRRLN